MWFVVYVHSGGGNVVVELVSDVDCHAGAVYGDVFDAQAEKLIGCGACHVFHHS